MVGKSNWEKAKTEVRRRDEQNRHRRKQKNYEARVEAFVKTLVTGKVHIVMRGYEGLRVMATNYEKWLASLQNSHNVQYIATPEKAEAWLRRQIARTRRKEGV